LFVWEKEWGQFTNKDGLSLVEASENPNRWAKAVSFWCRSQKPDQIKEKLGAMA